MYVLHSSQFFIQLSWKIPIICKENNVDPDKPDNLDLHCFQNKM